MSEEKPNSRLETFCDGVFAIALTLLIIDIKIPSRVEVNDTSELWLALKHITPSIFSFVLSFMIILITWVNHHNFMKLTNKSSASFIYANGFLLLTVVFVPFPTSLVGEYISTDYAVPAVVLYNTVLALQAIGWVLMSHTALKNNLSKNEKAAATVRQNGRFGYFAILLYSICAITAFWLPLTMAIVTAITWLFWLIHGININAEVINRNK